LGIQVLIADMPNYNAADRRDVLIRQIRAAIAEENRKDIIEKLWKGRQERTRRGEWPGGTVPYGFYRENKKLVTHPVENAIVLQIFGLADDGLSSNRICRQLNATGSRRRNGAEWTARQVRSILANREFYETGRIRYGEVCSINERLILIKKSEALCA
jgi:site-specific DNA recombinase